MEGDTSRLSAIDAGADASLLLEVVMDVVVLIGRILFAALFAVSAMGTSVRPMR